MKRSLLAAIFLSLGCALLARVELSAAPPAALAGRWKLNRELSQFPAEVGFDIDTSRPGFSQGGRQGGGGRGGNRRGGGGSSVGGSAFGAMPLMESEEDANKIRELIADAKNPSPVLTISQTNIAVTVTDAQDRARTFHPNGKEETQQLDAGPIGATSKWNGHQLVIEFKIEKERLFRYGYSRSGSGQLLVETRLEDRPGHDAGDVIKRVYDLE